MKVPCDVPALRWSDFTPSPLSGDSRRWTNLEHVITHSGKSALSHTLAYLRSTGALQNKNSKIWTPPWLGYWVYNAMQAHGFPVLHEDAEARVALAYHQYGFAQDMDPILDYCRDRKIVLIEDCAHALDGSYKGKPLGSFGLAGIFSFSKFVPSLIGGAVRSADADLRAYVSRKEETGSRGLGVLSFGVKWALQNPKRGRRENGILRRINELLYAGYPYSRSFSWARCLHSESKLMLEILARRRHYALYRSLLSGFEEIQRLDPEACPYVLPFLGPKREALEKIAQRLREYGVDTGVYFFDVERNFLRPRYEPCLWLPVHSGVSEGLIERIATTVKGNS